MQTMRDVLIKKIYDNMKKDKNIFFLSADFGAPGLDRLRNDFKDRFINVGIAEQNLINISCGLALEGFTIFAYAIAPFLVMRACEQIRNNVSLMHQFRKININLIGVGAGLSYDISGPSHHSLEDISIMRTLPNFIIFSPSDWVLTQKFIDYSIKTKKPKYIRIDGNPLPQIYTDIKNIRLENGFSEIIKSKEICLVATGYMTHKALKVADFLNSNNFDIGVVDVFLLKPINEDLFYKTLKKYKTVITLEEAFINKGGLDSLVASILNSRNSNIRTKRIGFEDRHILNVGKREYLHKLNGLDDASIVKFIKKSCLRK